MATISVIIPTFNRRERLVRALDSVAAQTFQDWELVIVDDGSQDDTRKAIHLWQNSRTSTGQEAHSTAPQPVRYLYTENRGVSAARNFGLQNSSAPWVAFLDSDDEWLANKLELQLALALESPVSVALIHGDELWRRNGEHLNQHSKHRKSGGRIFTRCVDLCCISPSAALVKRRVLTELGAFREDFPVCEDYELWLRISARYQIGFVPTPLIVKHGGHADQLSNRYVAMDYWRVKALSPLLHSQDLSPTEIVYVAEAIQTKCDILLRGYEKHGNRLHAREVQGWSEEARSFLTQAHSTHSTAAFFPRSDVSGIL